MSLERLREKIPAYAKDLSLNLSSRAGETLLTDQQKWGAFLASAASRTWRTTSGWPTA